MTSLKERNLLKIKELQPRVQWAAKLWCEECDAKDYPIKISEAFRSQRRQRILYAQGRGSPGRIVTYTLRSNHTRGMALDVYAASGSGTRQFYETIEHLGKKYNITHPFTGRYESFVDLPHFEFMDVGPKPMIFSRKAIRIRLVRALARAKRRFKGRALQRIVARIERAINTFS